MVKKHSDLLYSEEPRALRIFAALLVVCVLLVIFVVFGIANHVYDNSAQRYFQQQSTQTLSEVSSQTVQSIAVNLNGKQVLLDLAGRMLKESDADGDGHYSGIAGVLADANASLGSEFQHLGVLYANGSILSSSGGEINAADQELIQAFLEDPTPPGLSVGVLNGESAGEDQIIFLVPYPHQNQDNIVGIVGLVPVGGFAAELETNIFGQINNYVVLAWPNGDIVADTNANRKIDTGVYNVFSRLMPQVQMDAFAEGFASGGTDTLAVSGTTTDFLMYYAPVFGNSKLSEDRYSASNLRLMVMVRADVVHQNIANLFDESRLLLDTLLGLLGVALLALVVFFVKSRSRNSRIENVRNTTGLLYRQRFEKDAEKLLRRHQKCAVVVVDIKHFHLLNENLGRKTGDQILVRVAEVLKGFIDDRSELACHDHADTFILFLNTAKMDARDLVDKLQERLKGTEYPSGASPAFSFGIYKIKLKNLSGSIESIIDDAIEAERSAGSEENGNNIVVFNKALKAKRAAERLLEQRAEAAMENGEFVAFYQLKRGLAQDRWCGAEALVRWIDPEEGMISPGAFIPPFEHSGFITKVDLFVFERVCEDLQLLCDTGRPMLPVSVNLSKRHFVNNTFFDKYESVLSRYTFPHEFIEFEVTESLVLEDEDMLRACIGFVHNMGCLCCLDDFGSGDASFNMIKEFDFDIIKLDRSFFVGSNGFDEVAQLIVESLVDLSHKLGKIVVAEGIEEESQVAFLRSVGCDIVQGYYFAKPQPFENSLAELSIP